MVRDALVSIFIRFLVCPSHCIANVEVYRSEWESSVRSGNLPFRVGIYRSEWEFYCSEWEFTIPSAVLIPPLRTRLLGEDVGAVHGPHEPRHPVRAQRQPRARPERHPGDDMCLIRPDKCLILPRWRHVCDSSSPVFDLSRQVFDSSQVTTCVWFFQPCVWFVRGSGEFDATPQDVWSSQATVKRATTPPVQKTSRVQTTCVAFPLADSDLTGILLMPLRSAVSSFVPCVERRLSVDCLLIVCWLSVDCLLIICRMLKVDFLSNVEGRLSVQCRLSVDCLLNVYYGNLECLLNVARCLVWTVRREAAPVPSDGTCSHHRAPVQGMHSSVVSLLLASSSSSTQLKNVSNLT
jgi:hypothetical protein